MAIGIGTVVRLKSGGAKMTVEKVEGGKARCSWLNANDMAQQQLYPIEVLEEVKDKARPLPKVRMKRPR